MATPQPPKRSFLIGRSAECDIIVNHPEVSGRHAILAILPDGTVEIRDIGSKNGTFINGKKVLVDVLRPGDKLSLGSHTIDWEEILRNPPPPVGGSGSPTRLTRVPLGAKNFAIGIAWVILAIVIVGAILWFFVRPWVFQGTFQAK